MVIGDFSKVTFTYISSNYGHFCGLRRRDLKLQMVWVRFEDNTAHRMPSGDTADWPMIGIRRYVVAGQNEDVRKCGHIWISLVWRLVSRVLGESKVRGERKVAAGWRE